jgi:hypothetical protein
LNIYTSTPKMEVGADMKMIWKKLLNAFRKEETETLSERELRAILSTREILGVPLSGWVRSSMGDLYEGRPRNELGPGFGSRVKKRSA